VFETDQLNATAQQLFNGIQSRYPAWASYARAYGPDEDPCAEPGSVCFEVPSPAHDGEHLLGIYLRGNTIEIAYEDNRPPGPAEMQFVFLDPDKTEPLEAALAFVADIMNDRVVVGRQRLPALVRLFRGRACADVPRCLRWEHLTEQERRKLWSIASWTGFYDTDPHLR
jgi:hypothetical protein